MAQPVWLLSVDLQTKTATFQSGMAEAAKSARGAFTDIKSGAGEMGRETGVNMMEARHGVMMLGEEFGVHLPRALTSFIASIGPVGAAMEAAFPFLAIALGATLLIEHIAKLKEEGKELTREQENFGIAANNSFNALNQKLLQTQIKADELRNDHLGALSKQLKLIDMQSMAELEHSFEELGRRSDAVFKKMETHWYSLSRGSAGAKNSFEEINQEYRKLLSEGKGDEASGFLTKRLEREKHLLEQMVQMENGRKMAASGQSHEQGLQMFNAAQLELKRMNVDLDKESVGSMQRLVDALQEQVGLEKESAGIKALEKGNAKSTEAHRAAQESAAAASAAAESKMRIGELALTAERATVGAQLAIQRASIEEKKQSEIAFAERELNIRQDANSQLIDALDKTDKAYQNRLKALHGKAEELTAQHAARVAAITSQAAIEQNNRELQTLEQGIRDAIEATDKGTVERLAAIDAGLKAEADKHMQDMATYRNLMTQRVKEVKEAAAEESKLRAEAGKEMAESSQKMGELAIAAEKEQQQLKDSARHVTIQMRIEEEKKAAEKEYDLHMDTLKREAAALEKGAKDYENKFKANQDKQKQLIQQHENEITAIKDKAEMARNSRILSGETRLMDSLAGGLTRALMAHQSFAAEMNSIGNQIVSGMMQNAIKSVLANDFTKESDAAAAARKAYLAGMHFPFPANIVMGPLLGAMAFASVMAFENGTDSVPGIGRGDRVPAMLTPGEGIVPGGVMDGLRSMARSGNMGGGQTIHVRAHFAPTVHALDADGVDKVLSKHADKFRKHLEGELRKMNR
jgi:hypothetical protein